MFHSISTINARSEESVEKKIFKVNLCEKREEKENKYKLTEKKCVYSRKKKRRKEKKERIKNSEKKKNTVHT